MQSRSIAFLRGRRLGCAFNASWRVSSTKRLRMNCLYISILYYIPVLSSYVRDHAASPRISVNADFSTPLKCLGSGNNSIEQLGPSAPRQTSALELLVFYCFRILLEYPCSLWNVNFITCAWSLSYPPWGSTFVTVMTYFMCECLV